MKTILAVASIGAVFLGGCAYRDAKMWQDDFNKALQAKNGEIQSCYEGIAKASPGAGGKVTITFEVETDGGKVTNVQVDKANTTAPENVQQCVTTAVSGLVLSPPDRRVGQGTSVFEFSQPKG